MPWPDLKQAKRQGTGVSKVKLVRLPTVSESSQRDSGNEYVPSMLKIRGKKNEVNNNKKGNWQEIQKVVQKRKTNCRSCGSGWNGTDSHNKESTVI